jgi:sensor domain CHASE-containing protein
MIELSVIRDLVAIFGVIAGFSYYVLTVRANQKNQELTLKAQAHVENLVY